LGPWSATITVNATPGVPSGSECSETKVSCQIAASQVQAPARLHQSLHLTGPGIPPASLFSNNSSRSTLGPVTSHLLPNIQTAPPSQQSFVESWSGLLPVSTEGLSTNGRRVLSYQRNSVPTAATSSSFGSVRTGAPTKRSRSTYMHRPANHPLLSIPSYAQATSSSADAPTEEVLVCLLPYTVLVHLYNFISFT
jgi:hypothetical protein